MVSFFKTPHGIVALGFLIFGGYFLITEHAAHTIAWLPWLILLACPLLHIFMHHGHGQGGNGNHSDHSGVDDHETPNLTTSQSVHVKGGDNNE